MSKDFQLYDDRVDGIDKVTGKATYTAEQKIPNLAYAVFVCSTIAKGSIKNMILSKAKNAPGVLDIIYYGNDKINIILEFFNDEAAIRMVLSRFYIPQLKRQQEKAITLIEFLQKEYNLED